MLLQGVEYSQAVDNFYVRYNAPSRNFSDLRTEFNQDALSIKEKYGSAYVLFSSGVDSQIIARCFKDMDVDAEYHFIHAVGCNDIELTRVYECEKFYGIRVHVTHLNLDEYKNFWIQQDNNYTVEGSKPSRMIHYAYQELVKKFNKDIPIISQGANEPCFVAPLDPTIYCGYYEGSQERFRFLADLGHTIYDFPFSPEAVASYYTDNNTQTFLRALPYYYDLNLHNSDQAPLEPDKYWNTFGKVMTKGSYFKKDIIYYGKLSGYENYPDWIVWPEYLKKARITVRYWDLFEFLSNSRTGCKDYNEWLYEDI